VRIPARRWVRWLLATFAALLLVVALAATWLVTTEAGLRRAAAMAESVGTVELRVINARGRLIGPLAIEAIEIEHPRASVRIEGFAADYEPLEILAGRISAEGLRVDEAAIALRPATGPKRPPSFMPGGLTIALDDATVGELTLQSPSGSVTRFRDIRASARIGRSAIAFRDLQLHAEGWAVRDAKGALYARDPLALDVAAAWEHSVGDRASGSARVVGDLARLRVNVELASPARGRVAAEVRDVATETAFRGRAAIESLDLEPWMDRPPVGPLAASLDFEGNRTDYAVRGSLSGRGLPDTGMYVDARASFERPVLRVESLSLTAAGSLDLRAAGTLRIGEEPTFDVAADWDALQWPLAGDPVIASARGSLQARGGREFDYRVAGSFAPAAGPAFAGEASGRLTESALQVEASSWQVLGGDVSLAGSLGRGEAKPWSVSGRAARIDPSGMRPQLPGRLGFRFTASGEGFAPDGPWTARILDLDGSFRGQPVDGGGLVRRAPGLVEFEDLALSLGTARLQADGTIGHGADFDARLVAEDLSAILPELDGEVNATAWVRGDTVRVSFTGHDLEYGSHHAVVLSIDASIDREGREHSWLRLRSNGITVAGLAISDTRLALDGLAQDHTLAFRVGAGRDAVALRGHGAWKDDGYTLALEDISATGPRIVPWKLASPSRLTASAEAAALEPVCVEYETRRICLEGRWIAGGAWSVAARTDGFPLEALDPKRRGAPGYRGLLAIDAQASGRPGEPWIADVEAEIRDASLTYASASGSQRQVALGTTNLSLDSSARQHRLELRVSDAEALQLSAVLEATREPGAGLAELPLRGQVRGRTRQLNLLPLLVDAVDVASGVAALDLRLAGRVGAPRLSGTVRLTEGSLDFYQTNLRLRDLRATVRLADSSLTLDAAGKAGEGTLEIDGRLGWQDRELNGQLNLSGERLLVANVPEARVLASPDLRFRIDERRIEVTGEVLIPEARIRPAETAGAILPSADERVVNGGVAEEEREAFAVTSDVSLRLGEEVSVKAFGLSATIAGAVRTRLLPNESPTGSGELEVKEGEYNAYGRELEIERGKLLFTGGPLSDPGVDLRASRELPGYTVGVIARGPLRRPQLTLFSEPSLPQAQIASMLIVGRSSIQGDPGAEDAGVSGAEQGGAILAGQLGKYVGLDDIGLTQDEDTGSQLVIGKYLSPRLYVSYGISLVEEINTLKLRYTIGDRWTLSLESGLEQAFDVEYRIED
jgi:translocation and assembly module TamB